MNTSPASRHAAAKCLVLGQEAVAGMHRIGAARFCRLDDRRDIEIGLRRRRLADPHRLIGLPHMQRIAVGVGIDRNHAIAERCARCA
jgi:hypothetical protein